VNAILGEERVIVSEVAGTTRDAIDTPVEFEGRALTLVDTAGLRRRGSIEPGVEKHASLRARRALDRADIAVCVFDMSEGFTAQDAHIAGFAIDASRGLIICGNKLDLVEDGAPIDEWERQLRWKLKFAPWSSIRFVSAVTRAGLPSLLREAVRIGETRRRRIETGPLNQVVRRAVAEKPPPTPTKGKRLKVFYATQAEVDPPTFVFFMNDASLVHFSYKRYLENAVRRAFGFEGTAVKMVFRSREERAAG
jgi:GTP-binding protein